MSQSTKLYTSLRFPYKSYNDIYEVNDDLNEVNERIRLFENHLRTLVFMTEPQKFKEADESSESYLTRAYNETIESLSDLYVDRFKLEKLVDEWDACHNKHGQGINPPEEIKYKSYIDGDFVYTEKHPTKESLLS